ncbi:MAG: transposase, partial [Candidatus Jettenia sp.]|nr:transposase [Candidatus Jettenia sp.]
MKQQKQKRKKKALRSEKIRKAKEGNKSKKAKKLYRVRNWSEYNNALRQRGALEVWIDERVQERWHRELTGQRGSPGTYSDMAIITTLQLGTVFHQRLRQTEGCVKSLFRLMNIPEFLFLPVRVQRYGSMAIG